MPHFVHTSTFKSYNKLSFTFDYTINGVVECNGAVVKHDWTGEMFRYLAPATQYWQLQPGVCIDVRRPEVVGCITRGRIDLPVMDHSLPIYRAST